MRFLADENIAPIIVAALIAEGYDAISVADTMPGVSDEVVLARAFEEARILLTEDKDFGELAFKHDQPAVGIVRLALPGQTPEQKAKRLCAVLASNQDGIVSLATVVEPTRIRMKSMAARN